MICPGCGKEVKDSFKFCPVCGASLAGAGSTEAGPSLKEQTKKVPDPDAGKGGRKGNAGRRPLLYVLALLAVLIPAFLAFFLFGDKTGERLEEQLRLGAQYLEEMRYDLALDAYAAAIEIDENDPRPYLGQADVYMTRAENTFETARSEEDLERAREDMERAREVVEKAREKAGDEENTGEEEEGRLGDLTYIYQASRIEIEGVSEEILLDALGLPYIGNTKYQGMVSESWMDLYDGAGYISAAAEDLDLDGRQEILVVSLEGEDTLGEQKNALYLHVLEFEDGSWQEAARHDLEEDPEFTRVNLWRMHDLTRNIFLRREGEGSAVYTESFGDNQTSGENYWSLFRYVYDGSFLTMTEMGDVEGRSAQTVMQSEGSVGADFRQTLQALADQGLPVWDGSSLLTGIMLRDQEALPLAAFVRKADPFYHGDPSFRQTYVSLIDYTKAREDDTDYEAFYSDVLDQYRELYRLSKEGPGAGDEYGEQNGLNWYFGSYDGDRAYIFRDLNGDGFLELILGKSYGENMVVCAVYTNRQGEAANYLDFPDHTYFARNLGDRYQVLFDPDPGLMYVRGSGSYDSSYVDIYSCGPDRDYPELIEGFAHYGRGNPPYYHTDASGETDRTITPEELSDAQRRCEEVENEGILSDLTEWTFF